MTKNISVGGKSYEVSEEVAEKIDELVGSEDVVEIEDLESLVGKKWAFQCARYIYFGKVKSITNTFIDLEEAQTVFETGEYCSKEASDSQEMPKGRLLVMRQAIEAIYPTKW